MRHHLKIVASNFKVDQKQLENFALKNKKRYGIEDENGFITTSTMYTEDLIRDFKKESYEIGTRFYSATGKVKAPLTVTILKTAEHEDRKNRISAIKTYLITTWNMMYPKKYGKINYEDENFKKETVRLRTELKYILSLKKDIVNLDGGVIYCGETDTWAEIVERNEC